ncbi:MAG TPA: YetF domain-containing protein [Pseudonocardia sp.]|nr:YetF domain-containing protein [Pseudonocardia sp.]
MPSWLVQGWVGPATAAAKAALMYAVALAGLRLTPRRTLSQWTAIDFAAAVALGAIIGRTAVASDQSVAIGVAARAALLLVHWALAAARVSPRVARLVDHRIRVLVDHGRLRRGQLRWCGLNEDELMAQLREKGVTSIGTLRYVLYETKGQLTIVREEDPDAPDPDLVRAGLRGAAAFPAGRARGHR